MKKLLSFALGLLASACIATAADVKVLMWSDYIDPDICKQFKEATGQDVKVDVYEDTESMMAKLQAAGGDSQYDVVVGADHSISVLTKLNLIQKLDKSKIPNAKNVSDMFASPPFDPGLQYSQPYQWGTMGIIYNKKKMPNFKPSWDAFFGAKHPGTFMMLDSMRDTISAGLMADSKSINARDLKDIQNAGKKIIAAKKSKQCLGFDGSPANAKKVASGQCDFALVYNGDALNAIKEAKTEDVDYAVPESGSQIWVDVMVIPAHAPNVNGAHQFINYIMDAKIGAQLSNYINYASPNKAALPMVDEASRKDVRIYPTEAMTKKFEFLEDVGKATQNYDKVWTSIKSK